MLFCLNTFPNTGRTAFLARAQPRASLHSAVCSLSVRPHGRAGAVSRSALSTMGEFAHAQHQPPSHHVQHSADHCSVALQQSTRAGAGAYKLRGSGVAPASSGCATVMSHSATAVAQCETSDIRGRERFLESYQGLLQTSAFIHVDISHNQLFFSSSTLFFFYIVDVWIKRYDKRMILRHDAYACAPDDWISMHSSLRGGFTTHRWWLYFAPIWSHSYMSY